MSLTNAAITEVTVESAPLLLVDEFLKLYFDGAAHALGSNSAHAATVFPKVRITFGTNQPPASQPLREGKPDADTADAQILVLLLPRGEQSSDQDCVLFSGKLVTSHVLFNFWVFARTPGDGQSERLAQNIGQLLKAILTNPSCRYVLAEKGVTHLQPQEPQWLTNTDYARRLVACAAQLQYPVEFGSTLPTTLYDEQIVGYFNQEVLIVGSYLLGEYQWTRLVRLASARVTAWSPQVSPVVIELEIAGVLSGLQLTIPIGVGNEEVSDEVDLGFLEVNNQNLRWKVISGPAPEDSAWHVAVMMHVRMSSQ